MADKRGSRITAMPTTDDVINICERMEKALNTCTKNAMKPVKLTGAEVDLLQTFEDARDIMKFALEKTNNDRTKLAELFSPHGNCMYIARIHAVLENAEFTKPMNKLDQRTDLCKKACHSVEQVLADMGLKAALERAEAAQEDKLRGRQQAEFFNDVNHILHDVGLAEETDLIPMDIGVFSQSIEGPKTPGGPAPKTPGSIHLGRIDNFEDYVPDDTPDEGDEAPGFVDPSEDGQKAKEAGLALEADDSRREDPEGKGRPDPDIPDGEAGSGTKSLAVTIPTDVAFGFVTALRKEYIHGTTEAVGEYFDSGVPEFMFPTLEKHEATVRGNKGDKPGAIKAVAEQLGVDIEKVLALEADDSRREDPEGKGRKDSDFDDKQKKPEAAKETAKGEEDKAVRFEPAPRVEEPEKAPEEAKEDPKKDDDKMTRTVTTKEVMRITRRRKTVKKIITPMQQKVTTAIQTGELRRMTVRIFTQIAVKADADIDWNSGNIRSFITAVFDELKLDRPQEKEMYTMYSRFDDNGDWKLSLSECQSLIEALVLQCAGIEMQGYREKVSEAVGTGQLQQVARDMFAEMDINHDKVLGWNNGEIRNFLTKIFAKLSLEAPSEEIMFALFSRFDTDGDNMLDVGECERLALTVATSLHHIQRADESQKCPKGHRLYLVVADKDDYTCDVCQNKFKKNTALWECAACDYDMCCSCLKKKRGK